MSERLDRPICDHGEFEANVSVVGLSENEDALTEGEPKRFVAEVIIRCADCHERFGFHVPDIGILSNRPTVSPDYLELRVPLMYPSEAAIKTHIDDGEG